MGSEVCQIFLCGCDSGSNTGTALGTAPSVVKNATLDGAGAESSGADAAQQRSASA